MTSSLTALIVFMAIFAIATLRGVHVGVLMFAAACGVGVGIAGMPLKGVITGFPVGIMVLLVGVTYFFAIAQANGTIDRLIDTALRRVRHNASMLPFVFFVLTGAIAAMGSPLAGLVMAPIGMPLARKHGMDPMLMAVAIGSGFSAGGFAPTSLFGIVTYGTARQAHIDLNPLMLLAVASVANLALLAAAFVFFGHARLPGTRPTQESPQSDTASAPPGPPVPFTRRQVTTVACMIGLLVTVVGGAVAGLEPDVGVLCFAFGALLTLVDPESGNAAVTRIDWSTVLLVGGIGTFVGVLQHVGAVEMLGEGAKSLGSPILAALAVCGMGGLVSAFASTTGILVALVPLALPLVASGDFAGWSLICALAVCSSIVDISPFSTVGAALVATSAEDERPRMTSLLTRWGLCLVVVGPLVLVGLLVLPTMRP
jgi:Na+/H+ antiporter NhaD/arsenite permease-like protein